jgi:hypothetical protein
MIYTFLQSPREDCEDEVVGVVFKLNIEKRVSTGDVRESSLRNQSESLRRRKSRTRWIRGRSCSGEREVERV